MARKAVGVYESARGNVRDALPFVDNTIDQSLPYANAAEAGALSLMGEDKAYLQGGAIDLVRGDPDMQRYEQELLGTITSDPRYMNEAFPYEHAGRIVEFGGERADYPMSEQAKAPWKSKYRATWAVALREETWLLRHSTVTANAQVSADGNIVVSYGLTDDLDLRPNEGRTPEYNAVCSVLGPIWHGMLRGSEMDIEANWTITYYSQE